jgi:hypothetical protein
MHNPDAPGGRSGLWRIVPVVLSAALGLAAVCLVVFSTSQKQIQIGVLLGLWGGLIAAFVVFGSRRTHQGSELQAAELQAMRQQAAELQAAQLEVARQAHASQEVELRRFGELQLARETAARREADFRLEIGLRQEIERVLAEQIGSLRDEVAALRAEVVDKLGGQLRLERIETTRLIGSDLEALQHEIRRLAGSKESLAAVPVTLPSYEQPTTTLPDLDDHEIVDAEVVEAESPTPNRHEPVNMSTPEPTSVAEPVPAPEVAAPVAATPPAEPVAPPAQAAPVAPPAQAAPPTDAFGSSRDPFAGLPRLTPISADVADLLLPPTPSTPVPDKHTKQSKDSKDKGGRRRAPDEEEEVVEPKYVGRRRAAGEARSEAPAEPESEPGGRRRAPDDAPEDLTARLLDR